MNKNGYYLIKDIDRNLYFGWEDTDICLAPIDKPQWYKDPFMPSNGEYWLQKYNTEQDAKSHLDDVKRYTRNNVKVVHITLKEID